jgi:hypothetical protein
MDTKADIIATGTLDGNLEVSNEELWKHNLKQVMDYEY